MSNPEPTPEQIAACMGEARNLACITQPLNRTKGIARTLAQRDATIATQAVRILELEAPGECASLHKLRARILELEAVIAGTVDPLFAASFREQLRAALIRTMAETITTTKAERDELALTLANERGEGSGPSEGWARTGTAASPAWMRESGLFRLRVTTSPYLIRDQTDPSVPRMWRAFVGHSGTVIAEAHTARKCMSAADKSAHGRVARADQSGQRAMSINNNVRSWWRQNLLD